MTNQRGALRRCVKYCYNYDTHFHRKCTPYMYLVKGLEILFELVVQARTKIHYTLCISVLFIKKIERNTVPECFLTLVSSERTALQQLCEIFLCLR